MQSRWLQPPLFSQLSSPTSENSLAAADLGHLRRLLEEVTYAVWTMDIHPKKGTSRG